MFAEALATTKKEPTPPFSVESKPADCLKNAHAHFQIFRWTRVLLVPRSPVYPLQKAIHSFGIFKVRENKKHDGT